MIAIAFALAVAMPAKYERLVADPRVARTIEWDRLRGKLAGALVQLEAGRRLDKIAIDNADALTEDEAGGIYAQRVAISLWVEANHKVAWSLFDVSPRERDDMIGFRRLFRVSNGRYTWVQRVKDLDPYWSYEFMTANQRIPYLAADRTIARPTPKDTVIGLLDRLRSLTHHAADDEMNAPKPPARQIIDGNITTGCWGTSGLIVTLLRSVNIAASQVTHSLNGHTHSSVLFTGIGNLTMTHGDDPYNQLLLAAPSRDLLIDNDTEWIAMSADAQRENRWHAVKGSTCINARYVLALSCTSPVYDRIMTKEIDPYLSPDESAKFHGAVESIRRTCPSFNPAAREFPMQCWSPR